MPESILVFHDLHRQAATNSEEHESSPLPPKWIDHHTEDQPVYEFRVGEKIKGTSWRQRLDEAGHVDPSLHPVRLRSSERIDEEHEEKAGVDTYVVVTRYR